MSVKTLAILGAGDAGIAAARLAALAGLHVRLWDPSEAALRGALLLVRQLLEEAVRDGQAPAAHRQTILDGVLATTDLEEAVAGADAVLETGPEAAAVRADVLGRAAAADREAALLASGSLEAVSTLLPDPSRLAGLVLGERPGEQPPRAAACRASSPRALGAARELAAALARAATLGRS